MLCHVFWSQVEYKIVRFIFSLLDCIVNILNHSSEKCRDSHSDNGCSEFHQVNWPLYNNYLLIPP